jgi:transglutaminase-like putative cysteine protease
LPSRAVLTNKICHDVDFSVVITAPANCKKLAVWLPLPPSNELQTIEDSRLSTFPVDVSPRIASEPVFGNRFAYYEFDQPSGGLTIRHQFRASVYQGNWNVVPSKIERGADWGPEFKPFLQLAAVDDLNQFEETMKQIGTRGPQSAEDIYSAMDWIDQNLTYSNENASLVADVNHAFNDRTGHCSDYHGLCAEMGRRMGYPGRVMYGLCLFPKSSPSHCKLELFLPGYGWVLFDLSETQKLVKRIQSSKELDVKEKDRLTKIVRARLKAGFRENSWLEVTRGTNYELAPKASGPVKLVRTIYAEADGVPLRDPDPANPNQREFSWMTVSKFSAKPEFELAFPSSEFQSIDLENHDKNAGATR